MITVLKWFVMAAVAFAAFVVVARFLFPLPDRSVIKPSQAIPLSEDTRWGRFLKIAGADYPGKSGVMPLPTGHEALGARLILTAKAERSIDLQYYIWHDDVSGRLLLSALHAAAKRGVRVRLLVDDNGVPGMDGIFSALDAVDNFEVRMFNPSRIRNPKLLGYTFDLFRMNRRMHNKAFIVDGAAAILGGRNIGDEYFSIGDHTYFLDLDVMAAGAIVPDTAADFDRYWNSQSVYPIDLVVGGVAPALPQWVDGELGPGAPDWIARLPEIEAQIDSDITSGKAPLEWTDVKLVSDDPAKGLGEAKGDQLMINQLGRAIGAIDKSLDLISAYFIPGTRGAAFFEDVEKAGAQVRILTNSMWATDVVMVHAGYTKYRRALLDAGIELFELKPQPGVPMGDTELSLLGSSGSSLHAKSVSIDANRIFVGSFNFDPRSVNLNCEMGFLIDSPAMAGEISAAFSDQIARGSYQVVLRDGQMRWIETGADGKEIVHNDEPKVSAWDRLMITVVGWLPIEWAL